MFNTYLKECLLYEFRVLEIFTITPKLVLKGEELVIYNNRISLFIKNFFSIICVAHPNNINVVSQSVSEKNPVSRFDGCSCVRAELQPSPGAHPS